VSVDDPGGLSTNEAASASEFAPGDITDGRQDFEWKSRWPADARSQIRREALGLAGYLLIGVTIFVLGYLRLFLPEGNQAQVFGLLAIWGAGLIGATCFGIKWFYHVVAKGLWHQDRALWRWFSPIVSSTLAVFVSLALLGDPLAREIDAALLRKMALLAFLGGYFSDSAFAKLAEVAKVLFGVTEKHQRKSHDGESDSA
jgi:hypothetical protein